MNRRELLSTLGATAVAMCSQTFTFAADTTTRPAGSVVKAGVLTDLHHLTFNRNQLHRLIAFTDRATEQNADFIIQCGDFCYPANCPEIFDQWNRFVGSKYHVLGNHDLDKCDKQTVTQLWGMKERYYSFDEGGFHFVVLDRNGFRMADRKIQHYAHGNWGKAATGDINCIDDQQLTWLGEDLKRSDKPTVVWMHQPLVATDNPSDIGNGQQIIDAFDLANFNAMQRTGKPRVVAVFFGHDHNDLYAERNGVHYVLLNSASYAYTSAGASYYRDPLFCFITFDPAGKITIEGRSTRFESAKVPEKVRMRIPAKISSRELIT